jgi:hypothetical protein
MDENGVAARAKTLLGPCRFLPLAPDNLNYLSRFSEEPPMPAALAFVVIPAKAGIQRQANPAGTTR